MLIWANESTVNWNRLNGRRLTCFKVTTFFLQQVRTRTAQQERERERGKKVLDYIWWCWCVRALIHLYVIIEDFFSSLNWMVLFVILIRNKYNKNWSVWKQTVSKRNDTRHSIWCKFIVSYHVVYWAPYEENNVWTREFKSRQNN